MGKRMCRPGRDSCKDTQNLFPLNSEKQKRVLLEIMGDFPSNERVTAYFKAKLEKEDLK